MKNPDKRAESNGQEWPYTTPGILWTGVVDPQELLQILWEEELQTLSREERAMLEKAKEEDTKKR